MPYHIFSCLDITIFSKEIGFHKQIVDTTYRFQHLVSWRDSAEMAAAVACWNNYNYPFIQMYPFFAMDSLQALQPAVGAAEHSGSCSTHTNHMPVCHNSLRYWSKYLTVTMWRRSPLTYYKCPHLPIIHFCEVCTLFFLQHFYKLRNWRCDPQIRGEHFGNKARQWLTTSTYTSSPCKTFVAKQGKAEMPNT